MKITVIGCGRWGSLITWYLDSIGHSLSLIHIYLVSPVRFVEELSAMGSAGFDNYIELGPNKVLTGLVKKTLKGANVYNVENEKTLQKMLEKVNG